jgi:hypothetical protein
VYVVNIDTPLAGTYVVEAIKTTKTNAPIALYTINQNADLRMDIHSEDIFSFVYDPTDNFLEYSYFIPIITRK